MKRLLKYAKKYWYMYTIGTVLLALSIALDFQNPVIMGRIIDEVVIARDLTVFRSLITGILLITLGRAIFGYIRELMFDLGGFNVTREFFCEKNDWRIDV
jgi:ATP-binding cassette subfamily B multidrug efflux pump